MLCRVPCRLLFFFNVPASTELYTLSHTTLFRSEAAEAGITVARAVGVLAEFAAAEIERQLGDPSRVHRAMARDRSEEHTSELQSLTNLVCRLLLEKKNNESHDPHALRAVVGNEP